MTVIPKWAEAIADGIDVECGQNLSEFTLGQICAALVDARQDALFEAAELFEGQGKISGTEAGKAIFVEVAAILRIMAKSIPGECSL